MKTQQIIPCSGWCYTTGDSTNGKLHVWDVAAWALMDDGKVVGLIPASDATNERNIACLTPPPPIGGTYFLKHSEDDPRMHPLHPDIVPPDPDSLPDHPLSRPGY